MNYYGDGGAFDALVEMIETLDEITATVEGTVASAAELGVTATTAVLPPAGRRTERHSSPDRETVWTQEVIVLRHIGGADSASMIAAMREVSAATEAIDDTLDTQVTLSGAAVVVRPFTWASGAAYEIPAESGQVYAGQSGTCEVVLIRAGERGA